MPLGNSSLFWFLLENTVMAFGRRVEMRSGAGEV